MGICKYAGLSVKAISTPNHDDVTQGEHNAFFWKFKEEGRFPYYSFLSMVSYWSGCSRGLRTIKYVLKSPPYVTVLCWKSWSTQAFSSPHPRGTESRLSPISKCFPLKLDLSTHLSVQLLSQVVELIIQTNTSAMFIYVLINTGIAHMFQSILWHKHIIYVVL